MTDHTPEPWQGSGAILTKTDWERAKACVNACAGIPTKQLGDVKALVEALQLMLEDYEDQNGQGFCECDDSVGLYCPACCARAALAAFRKD